jgi:hypothetical protein
VEHPKAIGDRSTLAIMLGLQAAGYQILVPFGDNARYDLAVDAGSHLMRVQCKTGRLRDGAVRFNACSNSGHHRGDWSPRRDYIGEVDAFAVYCAATGGIYLVPIQHVAARTEAALRIDPARNGQVTGVRRAADYLVGEVVLPAAA